MTDRSQRRKAIRIHTLLSGEGIELGELSAADRSYLDELAAAAAAPGATYASLRLRVEGAGSYPARAGGGWITPAVMASPVFRVARDIVSRVGIEQGRLAPPTNAAPAQFLSVAEVAKILGVTRQGVNAAITRKKIPAQKIGRDWILKLEDVRAFQAAAGERSAPGRKAAPGRKKRAG